MFDETTITFKEYKETYYELRLNEHKKEYVDYDDLTFIENELKIFRDCLESTKISVVRDIQNNGDFLIAYNTKIYDLLTNPFFSNNMDSIEDFDCYYNFEIGKKLKITFNKIIEFLQEKKIIINTINEYKSNFNQPDTTIIAILDGIDIPKEDSEKIQQSEKYLYLKETAKEYIEKHDKRLKEFLDKFEADKMDYIKKEIEYFENTLYDVQNSESSHDGHSQTGYDNFSTAYELVCNIGHDKFMYSTKAKLKFLESKIMVNSPFQNQNHNNNENPKDVNTINWQGTTLEFSEFTKALIESGFIGKVKNEKEVFEKMKQFFNVENFDKSDKLKQVRQRTKDLTPAINTLETALINWIRRKD